MSDFGSRIGKLSADKLKLLAMDLHGRLEAAEAKQREPIAIIGMGCRFPGGSDGPEKYWELLRDGVDAIGEVPPDRWDIDEFYDPDPDVPGKMATRWGGFLDDIGRFDTEFFGISPREAVSMDPQQRLLLETTWQALEHARMRPDTLRGSRGGVYVGILSGDYFQLQLQGGTEQADTYLATGGTNSVASGRLSYVLGLRGPAMSIDTACSSSLMAVHLACRALRGRECDFALAAGVNALIWPEGTITMSRGRMMAPDGRCKTFDDRADGFVRGEGCGVVVLKRLSDVRDDERVLALIRGSATNQDGRSNGLTAPSGRAQQAVIREALADARVAPRQVSYVEAHGTGTSLGDPIEVQALGAVLSEERAPDSPFLLGSVKTNFGHLEAAAGVAGLIKVVLALEHGEVPPHLHYETPSTHIDWDALPVRVPIEATPWSSGPDGRIAGISSFGLSGSNVHVVVSEAPADSSRESVPVASSDRPMHVVPVSARSRPALTALSGRYADFLEQSGHGPAAVARAAGLHRSHFEHRVAAVGESAAALAGRLRRFAEGESRIAGVFDRPSPRGGRPGVTFMFPGQGSQQVGMAQGLYESEPVFRETLDACDAILRPLVDFSLVDVLYPKDPSDRGRLRETRHTQPSLFSLEYALAQLWRAWGVEPVALVGHSLGEFVAACLAGVFDLEDGLRLVVARGALSQALPGDGAMAAVFMNEAELLPELKDFAGRVAVGAVNGPENTVLSGEADALEEVLSRLTERGVDFRHLEVSYAGHSPMVDPMLDDFREVASSIQFAEPRIELFSTLTGSVVSAEVTEPEYWVRHVREPVRFAPAVAALHEAGLRTFLEVGPHSTLVGLAQQCVNDGEGLWLPSLRRDREDWVQISETVAALYSAGIDLDWDAFAAPADVRNVDLPRYTFQGERHWIEPTPARRASAPGGAAGARVDLADGGTVFERLVTPGGALRLEEHAVLGRPVAPATAFIEWVTDAARETGAGPIDIIDLELTAPLSLGSAAGRMLQLRLSRPGATTSVELYSRPAAEGRDGWVRHGSCSFRPASDGTDTVEEGLSSIRSRCEERVDTAALYDSMDELGIRLGPSYRNLQSAMRGDREVLAEVQVGPGLEGAGFRTGWHPAVVDSCLQAIGVALADSPDGGLHMMVGLDGCRLVARDLPDTLFSHASLRPEPLPGGGTRADVRVFTPEGDLVARLDGVEVRPAGDLSSTVMAADGPERWLHRVQWEKAPVGESEDAAPSAELSGAVLLVLGEAGGRAGEVARRWSDGGGRTVLATPGSTFEPAVGDAFSVDLHDSESVRELLSSLEVGDDASGVTVVHALGIDGPDHDGEICRSALNLVQALATRWPDRPPRLFFLTAGAQAVLEDDGVPAPFGGALWGFGRSVRAEHPELWGGLIDLDPVAPVLPSALVTHLASQTREDQAAFRGEERWVARLVPADDVGRRSEEFRLRSDASYLVTGATGGIGLHLLRWLADAGAKNLAAVSRSEPAGAAKTVFEELRRGGCDVTWYRADASDRMALEDVLTRMAEAPPALRGVFHLAGVASDGMVAGQDWSGFAKAFGPKVDGSWYLHELTSDHDLDHFVLFASGAGLLGPPGVSNYAAANAFQDSLAMHRRAVGLPGLAIDWGAWADTGLAEGVGTDVQASWRRSGLRPMPVAGALDALGLIIESAASAHIGVLPVDWDRFVQAAGAGGTAPLFERLISSGAGASGAPGDERAHGLEHEVLSRAPGPDRRRAIEEMLAIEAGAELGIDGTQIDAERPLQHLGFDSLMAVQLKNRVQALLGVQLPMSRYAVGPTLERLATELEAEMSASSNQGLTRAAPLDPDRSDAADEVDLDSLSDDEVAAMLEEMMREGGGG